MRITIIDAEYGIGSCRTEDIPEWVRKLGEAQDVTFFYFHQRDWIVLNEEAPNFELYKVMIRNYLEMKNEDRHFFMQHTDSVGIKYGEVRKHLNYIIRIRRKLERSMKA